MLVTDDKKVSVIGRWKDWIVLKRNAAEELLLVKECAVYNSTSSELIRYSVKDRSFQNLNELTSPDTVYTPCIK